MSLRDDPLELQDEIDGLGHVVNAVRRRHGARDALSLRALEDARPDEEAAPAKGVCPGNVAQLVVADHPDPASSLLRSRRRKGRRKNMIGVRIGQIRRLADRRRL